MDMISTRTTRTLTHHMPEALLSTPADAAFCPACAGTFTEDEGYGTGTRYPGEPQGRFYAHCRECGSTDLLDTRSPWEVLREAQALLEEAQADPSEPIKIMVRMDVVDRVLAVAQASPCSCYDCVAQKRLALRL